MVTLMWQDCKQNYNYIEKIDYTVIISDVKMCQF